MPSLADRQARTSRRFHAMRVVRFGELWGGVPPFTHKQAPPRARRRQVHLVRVEVHRRRLPPQPDREACEVEAVGHVLVASGLEITTDVHGRRWNATPNRNCASVDAPAAKPSGCPSAKRPRAARLRWSVVQNNLPGLLQGLGERRADRGGVGANHCQGDSMLMAFSKMDWRPLWWR